MILDSDENQSTKSDSSTNETDGERLKFFFLKCPTIEISINIY